jgi:hypothetical protein
MSIPPPNATAGPAADAGSAPARHRVPVGWVVLVIAGALICLGALLPTAGGGFLVWANATQRDDAGYFTTP